MACLNVSAVRKLSRMMLVVVMLLLPVLMTGASLEVPGSGVHALNCCLPVCCNGHASHCAEPDECMLEHRHHHHCHECIRLLMDAGLRYQYSPVVVSGISRVDIPCPVRRGRCFLPRQLQLNTAPPYPGYLAPLRC